MRLKRVQKGEKSRFQANIEAIQRATKLLGQYAYKRDEAEDQSF